MRGARRSGETAQAMEIIRATLRQEVSRSPGSTATRGKLGSLLASLIAYVFAGLLLTASLARGMDAFTVGFFAATAFMLLVAVFVVMEFATIVTGPDDMGFYAPLPVASRVYVAAKLIVTCLFGIVFAVAYVLPAVVFLVATGRPVGMLAVHLYSILDAALVSCLAVTVILGLAIRFVSYKRVRDVAAWVQFVVFIAVYGGFSLFQRALGGAEAGVHLNLTPLLLLAPSAWAPSLFRLGDGGLAVAGVCFSIGAPVILFAASVHVIASSFDGKLAEAAVATPRAAPRARPQQGRRSLLWRSPEERAMALLIGNLFRHESQFRMGVLSIIPVTVLYVGIIIVLNRAPIIDPFSPAGRATFSATLLLYLAVGFYPTYVKNALTYATDAPAIWLFSTSPANPLLILRAARRFILVYFIAPYLLLLATLYAVLTREVLHTLQHFAAIALLVVIETDVLLLFSPQLPFSRAPTAGRRGGAILLRLLAGVVLLAPIYLLVLFVYPHPFAWWPAMAALAACLVAVRFLGSRYASARLEREEYVS